MIEPVPPQIPVSWGELLDKITILEIKHARIVDGNALANIRKEYDLLHAIAAAAIARHDVVPLFDALREVNAALWDIEDAIRLKEAAGQFGAEFVGLARSVYRQNDERAAIKRRINALLHSALVEEKSYAAFAPAGAGEPG